MRRAPVRLRPHHLMCVHGFKGKGYSPEFVTNFWRVIDHLNEAEARVEVVGSTKEDICAPCPNNEGTTCVDDPKIKKLDDAWVATLEVKPGAELSWLEVKKLIVKKATDEAFEKNCAPCSWKKLGYCKTALQALRSTLGVLAALFFFLHSAQAQPHAPKVLNIEELEHRIMLDKSKRIPAFFKVQSALNARDYKKALTAAKALEPNDEYADYYHYLMGQAEFGRMKKLMHSGSMATALVAGEQAKYHLLQVQGANAYTTLVKRSLTMLGEVDLRIGDIHLKAKRRIKAQVAFENGFQRLAQVNLLAMVPKSTIVSYALICEKHHSALCSSWLNRLAPLVARSDEWRLVEKFTAFKKPIIERTPAIPYKVDLDLQAFQKGFSQYLEGKFVEAYATWRDLLKEYPRTNIKLRTKFWMARAAQKSQHDVQAETLYREVIKDIPLSYYALLASWYSGIDIARNMEAELPPATNETPVLTPADVVRIRRAEVFIASAVPELAQLELSEVKASLNMSNEFLAYLAMLNHLAQNHQASFQMLTELSTRGFQGFYSSYGQKLYFPTLKLPLVRDVVKEFKVDPLLVLSVVKQESAFNQEAVSGANAFGLMQIIAPTARDLDPSLEVMQLFEPAYNIKLGSKYIRKLLDRYNGNVILALAGYNAGPGNADRWQREIKVASNAEEFIEQITFKETREYVQNILRNYYWYNKRIKGEALPNLSALTQAISPVKVSLYNKKPVTRAIATTGRKKSVRR